ncbi:MAG: hypothetical protein Q3962_00545 [Corynebacterium sp.]|nr:hypothetical protein [Corynebacterium sp.]
MSHDLFSFAFRRRTLATTVACATVLGGFGAVAQADPLTDFQNQIVPQINAALAAAGSSGLMLPTAGWSAAQISTNPKISSIYESSAYGYYRAMRQSSNLPVTPWNSGLFAEISPLVGATINEGNYNPARGETTKIYSIAKNTILAANLYDAAGSLGVMFAQSEGNTAHSYLAFKIWEDADSYNLAVVMH